mmetsp:Transcript_17337/g.33113  ORF Transcript_17337/g.33113 Transcript_17337/m.33113 type:complete len:207 (+) Transcript_17337:242-862(+)
MDTDISIRKRNYMVFASQEVRKGLSRIYSDVCRGSDAKSAHCFGSCSSVPVSVSRLEQILHTTSGDTVFFGQAHHGDIKFYLEHIHACERAPSFCDRSCAPHSLRILISGCERHEACTAGPGVYISCAFHSNARRHSPSGSSCGFESTVIPHTSHEIIFECTRLDKSINKCQCTGVFNIARGYSSANEYQRTGTFNFTRGYSSAGS